MKIFIVLFIVVGILSMFTDAENVPAWITIALCLIGIVLTKALLS